MSRPLLAAALFALGALALPARADTGVPLLLQQQGRLLDSTDHPVTAEVQMSFGLYDTDNPQRPTPVWHDDAKVQVRDGYYAYLIGSGTNPLDPAVLGKQELYISVSIGGVELLPRQRLATVPYALRTARAAVAETVAANGVDTAALKDGSVTLEKLALANGKFLGLDADTLDGLDSSAFAPAAIETKVDDTLARVTDLQTTLGLVKAATDNGATASAVATVNQKVDGIATTLGQVNTTAGAINTTVGDIKTTTATTNGTVSSINGTVSGMNTTVGNINSNVAVVNGKADALKTNVDALATQVAALTTTLDTLKKRSAYSSTCNEADTGWSTRLDCLADGRWHMLANVPPTDADRNGVTTGAETCKWIIDTLVAANLRGRAGVWEVVFSYDQDATLYRGFYRAQDDSNLTLVRQDGVVMMTTDNSNVQNCSMPQNPSAGYVANLSVKL